MSDQGVKNHPEGEDAVIHDLETEDRPPSAQDHEEQPDANPQEQPAPYVLVWFHSFSSRPDEIYLLGRKRANSGDNPNPQ
ncbi:hypothetical protein M408DRAFT_130996 [Serendipita vermifera MAFF 305830]|uniref:Uncharacterized protein n=1 Tax=Serendipita vermifera MAFF 305830 TaxID=933852 RepID=A0A0C3BB61_SERVB|nr:hypothetical protein M408DRAFT_130996 [Serendipita vermifera MAFF 305830]